MFRNIKVLVVPLAIVLLFLVSSMPAAADSNGVIKPAEGDIVSGSIGVSGIANDPSFAAWQLDLLPGGDAQNSIFIDRGTNAVPVAGRIGRIETTRYLNGDYRLRLRVIRQDQNYSEFFTNITIANEMNFEPNGIAAPMENVPVACLTTIQGIARSDDFRKWQLDLLIGGSENNVVSIGRGSDPRFGLGTFGQFDTTQIPDGAHLLRLRVVHADSNYDTYYSRITVSNKIMAGPVQRNTCNCALPAPDAPAHEPNGITNPAQNTVVQGTIPICGIGDDPNFGAWELDLLFNGDPKQAVMIGYGDSPQTTRAPFTLLDTSILADGRYGLRLRVARLDDTFQERTIFVCIANHGTASSSCAQ